MQSFNLGQEWITEWNCQAEQFYSILKKKLPIQLSLRIHFRNLFSFGIGSNYG